MVATVLSPATRTHGRSFAGGARLQMTGMHATSIIWAKMSATPPDAQKARDAYLEIFDRHSAGGCTPTFRQNDPVGSGYPRTFVGNGAFQRERAATHDSFLRVDMGMFHVPQRPVDLVKRWCAHKRRQSAPMIRPISTSGKRRQRLLSVGCRSRPVQRRLQEDVEVANPKSSVGR